MTDTETIKPAHSVPKAPNVDDLCEAIEQSVGRMAGEEVRCKRVYGNCYRCNWWQREGVFGGRITRSRFLRVCQTPDGLLIEDLTA